MAAEISYLTRVAFEAGVASTLPAELEALGIRRPFLVTDVGLRRSGLIDRLGGESLFTAWYDGTPANPSEQASIEAAALYSASDCDGIVALGGGSPMDLAKAVAILATHDDPLESFAAVRGGVGRIRSSVAPLIAIPTTAGTGSEVGRGALITLASGSKLALISPHLIPKRAICDPDLTRKLPPSLTAATGIDALTHCFETFLSPLVNPPAEAIALDGARRAWRWIVPAFEEGGSEARWHMMMAALEGGLTFQKGLGAVHALSHAAGALKDPILHHGTLNGVLLPHVLRFNEAAVGDKYATLREVLGLRAGTDLAVAVRDLLARLRMPTTLGAMGFREEHIADTVTRALADHSNPTTPRQASAGDYDAILRAAL